MSETQAPPSEESKQRNAQQYWGYLFNPDKTATAKLERLLCGIASIITRTIEPTDSPDLTPTQLAAFYRSVSGNYDPLFLATAPESIAFIYRSLGCLYSLQPPASAGSARPSSTSAAAAASSAPAFAEPAIPALKRRGFLLWMTIQALLGPEEYYGFMKEALRVWDIEDGETGEVMCKVLPRECFPAVPDQDMMAWYEGVSECLRREAEEEGEKERVRREAERYAAARAGMGSDVEARRKMDRYASDVSLDGSTDAQLDDRYARSGKPEAAAYFRNPLYRTVDGRPGVVRHRRPRLSPRESSSSTILEKGKMAMTTVGHVVRNVGSPYLWDPNHHHHQHREHERHYEKKDRGGHRERQHSPGAAEYRDHPHSSSGRRTSLPNHSHHLLPDAADETPTLLHPRHTAPGAKRRSEQPGPPSPASSDQPESSPGSS
ncbi:hypothetical protein LTR66_016981, partial [Elasticomyces elasticus]